MKLLSLTTSILTIFFYLSIPLTQVYAAAGCCSHHGGVNGCNVATNHQLCKDGTPSPTCLCSGGKITKTKKTETTNTMTTTPVMTPTPTTEMTTTTKIKGCCSKHGGVSQCDKKKGYQMCKDGTISSTCKC